MESKVLESKVLELKVRRPLKIRVVDGEEYTVEFPVHKVAELEKKVGRSFLGAHRWFEIKHSEVRDILFVGLTNKHPEEAADITDKVMDTLDSETIEELVREIVRLNYPKTLAKIEEAAEKIRKQAEAGIAPPKE